jgi:TPR repeat protein
MTVQDEEQLAAQAMEAGAYQDAVRLLQPLVERQSEYTLLTLGWIHETGATGASDTNAAQLYYEHAAARGSALAHLYLGRLFLGKGEETEARKAFEAGASLGDDECGAALRRLDDHRVEQLAAEAAERGDYEEAVRLLRPLAERNSEYALLTLGWICEVGGLGAPDEEAAKVYYEQAAGRGSATAYLYLGRLLRSRGEQMLARAAFEAGARLGDDECQSALRRLDDLPAEQSAKQAITAGDYEEALRLLLPLAERDSEYALRALGFLFETGATGARDQPAAQSYYERAVGLGSVPANFDLGRLLLAQGEDSAARAAFEAGAARGDIPCMAELGWMCVKGRGGPADMVAGSAWLEKAASAGHIFAQRRLLNIELENARSVVQRLSVRMRILLLAGTGAKEMWRNPDSDKLR